MLKYYDEDWVLDRSLLPAVAPWNTKVSLIDADTFTAASQYEDPCCLNFASPKRPGGGYKSLWAMEKMPIKTQEEDLFRRSNLPSVMDIEEVKKFYPLNGVKGIACDAIVDKDKFVDPTTPFSVKLITVAAVINPKPEQLPLVHRKIQRILDIAEDIGCRTLILGAWGCGVFNNDPVVVSQVFNSSIRGRFENVVFAIPNQESHVFKVFKENLQIS